LSTFSGKDAAAGPTGTYLRRVDNRSLRLATMPPLK
jgi:hypothetical protein